MNNITMSIYALVHGKCTTMPIDPAIASLLAISPEDASTSSAGGGGCSTAATSKISAKLLDGSTASFFVKTGTGSEASIMFAGEHESLNALASVVPSLAPRSFGHGTLAEQINKSFLVTEYIDGIGRGSSGSRESLAVKLARLHTKTAPVPAGYDKPQFGFHVPTCCGNTPQKNDFRSSWADFYANNRLRYITERSRRSNGKDDELNDLVERTCKEVVPSLIGDDHLKGIKPVVVHGDLWSGNAGSGRLRGMSQDEDIIYDSSACYAHSEYELGIMSMFGGFGSSFMKEYHKICPKSEPADEYDDRVALYQLYHQLNHHAMFGGYRSGATSIMRKLLKKYGTAKGGL